MRFGCNIYVGLWWFDDFIEDLGWEKEEK